MGRFAVIARRWQDLEAMAALCRLRAIPVQMQRDSGQLSLHVTREGDALLSLLRGEHRRTGRRRVLVRPRLLSRWFRRRFHARRRADRAPCRAALAQFIVDAESAVPGRAGRHDLIEAPSTTSGAIGSRVPTPAPTRRSC